MASTVPSSCTRFSATPWFMRMGCSTATHPSPRRRRRIASFWVPTPDARGSLQPYLAATERPKEIRSGGWGLAETTDEGKHDISPVAEAILDDARVPVMLRNLCQRAPRRPKTAQTSPTHVDERGRCTAHQDPKAGSGRQAVHLRARHIAQQGKYFGEQETKLAGKRKSDPDLRRQDKANCVCAPFWRKYLSAYHFLGRHCHCLRVIGRLLASPLFFSSDDSSTPSSVLKVLQNR